VPFRAIQMSSSKKALLRKGRRWSLQISVEYFGYGTSRMFSLHSASSPSGLTDEPEKFIEFWCGRRCPEYREPEDALQALKGGTPCHIPPLLQTWKRTHV
jgi:hypothetical protein